ncbi:MAG: glycosyltransferase, partial [Chloroflexota bacterium]
YMVTTVPGLDYNREDLPESVRYVGACHWTKPSGAAPPAWLDELPGDRPIVYVSEGTLPGQEPAVLRAAAEGLADLPVTVVMTTGRGRRAEDLGLGRVASNIRIEEWVPHDDLFPRVSAVVTTGGSGTVLGALSLGIPLVVVPMAWDQPENAWRVREAGAGLRIPLKKCDAGSLRHAVTQVLNEPSFRENAQRVENELAHSGGPPYAAELLEDLVNRTTDPG